MDGQTGKKWGSNEAAELTSDLMPRLDRLPWSRWHVKIVFALGCAWLLDALEANIIGSVLGILKNSWHFSSLQGSLTVSVWLVGIMVGAVVFGYLSDRFGRRPMFILTLLWYSLFTIACAFSQDIRVFIFLRFMAAIGIGGEYSAIASAVVEFIPKKARGKMDAFVMSLWPVGAMLSALFVVIALKFLPPETAWRAGFLLAVILAIFAVVIRRYLPESPRWLFDHQRIGEARAVVEAAEKEVMRSTGLKELPATEPIVMHVGMHTLSHHTKELFGRYPWRLALGSSLNFSQVALGYGSVAYASLVLFPATGTPPEAVPYYMMLAFFFAMCGGLTAMYMVDTVGRKITVVVAYASYPLSALSMIFVETTMSAVISLVYHAVLLHLGLDHGVCDQIRDIPDPSTGGRDRLGHFFRQDRRGRCGAPVDLDIPVHPVDNRRCICPCCSHDAGSPGRDGVVPVGGRGQSSVAGGTDQGLTAQGIHHD